MDTSYRLAAFAVALLGLLPGGPSRAADDPSQPAESAERVLKLAREYDFYGDAERRTKFVLQSQPLLTYSNPVRGEVYGNVFVWTWHGRPEVVGAIFDYRSENRFDSELHTLARAGVVGCRNGEPFWNPPSAGVTFQPVPDAPPPATTPAARLRQMRELAKDFTVERNHPEQMTGLMRLLPQPIYRYPAEAAQHPDGLVDGALFTFVEATDPEAYLLLEATGGENPQWRFALARMNIVEFRALYRGKTVWQVNPVTWDDVFDKQEPYAIVREVPRRGLVRTR